MPKKATKPTSSKLDNNGFCKEYIHHHTKKLMRAEDYGYKAWPFGRPHER